jgi:hypothetical protein
VPNDLTRWAANFLPVAVISRQRFLDSTFSQKNRYQQIYLSTDFWTGQRNVSMRPPICWGWRGLSIMLVAIGVAVALVGAVISGDFDYEFKASLPQTLSN